MRGDPAPGREPSAFETFDRLLRKVVAVPKSELDRREAVYKRQRARKKRSRSRTT